MSDVTLPLLPPRNIPFLTLVIGAATILGALAFQYIGGLLPCELCLEQRWPYYIAVPLSAVAAWLGREANYGRWPVWIMTAVGLIYLVSAGMALHHMGVEYHWWAGPTDCATSAGGVSGSIADLQAALQTTKVIRCDQPAWTFLGLSLAGYNFLISLALAAISLWPAREAWLERHDS